MVSATVHLERQPGTEIFHVSAPLASTKNELENGITPNATRGNTRQTLDLNDPII